MSSNTEGYSYTINVGVGAGVTLLDAGNLADVAVLDFDGVFIINKDDTNFVRLRLADTGAHTVDFKLEAGEFMVFWNRSINVDAVEGVFGAFTDIDTIVAQADTTACDVIIVAFRI